MCYTNRVVALNKYGIARKFLQVGKMENLDDFYLVIQGIFSTVKDLLTFYIGIMQPSLSVPVYEMVFEKRNSGIFHRPKDHKIVE